MTTTPTTTAAPPFYPPYTERYYAARELRIMLEFADRMELAGEPDRAEYHRAWADDIQTDLDRWNTNRQIALEMAANPKGVK